MDFVENISAAKNKIPEESTPRINNEIGILTPDHPLLEKFQSSLRAHLLRVQTQLLEEIGVLDHSIKVKTDEREECGLKLYDLQQTIQHQRNILDDYEEQIRVVSENRVVHESNIVSLKEQVERTSYEYKKEKQAHNELLMDLDSLHVLENNIGKWQKEIEDEVAVAKRIVSKDARDHAVFAEEKRKAEFFLFNLEAEVNRRDMELKSINEQISEQDGVINVLKQSLVDANTDLEALQQEHRRLMQSWGQVIVAVTHRDKVLAKVNEDLHAVHQKHKLLDTDIDGMKKSSQKEMVQNEKLEKFKIRLAGEINSLKNQVELDSDECNKIMCEIEKFNAILDQTESDLKKATQEGIFIQSELNKIQLKLEKQGNKKFELEELILELLQNQITTDKAGQIRTKILRDTQEKRRNLELNMSSTENQLSNILLDLEAWKGLTLRLRDDVKRLETEKDETDRRSQKYTDQILFTQNAMTAKHKVIDRLNQELAQLIEAAGGSEMNPDELKAVTLEKNISDIERKMKDVQNFWVRLQGNVVNITEKRNSQLNAIHKSRKQLMVVEQKALKIDSELGKLHSDEREITREMNKLTTKMDLLNTELCKRKQTHELKEAQCELSHQELTEKLKEAERTILEMEQEIIFLNRDVAETKIYVFEKHREYLSWETKFKVGMDTKKFRDNEISQTSEIAGMKNEIHRMEVRYGQLKRAQDRLVQDLENCVHHREHIFDSATCREKINGNKIRTRSNALHKLNEMRNRLRQTNSEIVKLERSVSELSTTQEQFQADIDKKQREIDDEKLQDNLIQSEIEQGYLLKQENLENIVCKQRRVKRYKAVVGSKTAPKCRGESIISAEMQRQKEVNEQLVGMVEGLFNDFPDNKFTIARILQTLKED